MIDKMVNITEKIKEYVVQCNNPTYVLTRRRIEEEMRRTQSRPTLPARELKDANCLQRTRQLVSYLALMILADR